MCENHKEQRKRFVPITNGDNLLNSKSEVSH